MTNDVSRQEVVVNDIRMPFGSMIVFMVKWAIASIPALIILVVLGVLFWGAAIGFLGSLTNFGRHKPAKATSTPTQPASSGPEESAYIDKVVVTDVTVGRTTLGEAGVFGEIKNSGHKVLKEVEITIFCLGAKGKPVFEKTYRPVFVSELGFSRDNTPLKPGYSRQFGVKVDDAPSEWSKKVDVKVTKIRFQ